MIIADACIFIDALRSKGLAMKPVMSGHPVIACGVAKAEVLKGAKNEIDRQRIHTFLSGFQRLDFEEDDWIALGDNLATLRRKGLPVPFPDVVLATLAIESGYEVWSNDRHFPLMQTVLPELKLFVEPEESP